MSINEAQNEQRLYDFAAWIQDPDTRFTLDQMDKLNSIVEKAKEDFPLKLKGGDSNCLNRNGL